MYGGGRRHRRARRCFRRNFEGCIPRCCCDLGEACESHPQLSPKPTHQMNANNPTVLLTSPKGLQRWRRRARYPFRRRLHVSILRAVTVLHHIYGNDLSSVPARSSCHPHPDEGHPSQVHAYATYSSSVSAGPHTHPHDGPQHPVTPLSTRRCAPPLCLSFRDPLALQFLVVSYGGVCHPRARHPVRKNFESCILRWCLDPAQAYATHSSSFPPGFHPTPTKNLNIQPFLLPHQDSLRRCH